MLLVAKRDIEEGEQLSYAYNLNDASLEEEIQFIKLQNKTNDVSGACGAQDMSVIREEEEKKS